MGTLPKASQSGPTRANLGILLDSQCEKDVLSAGVVPAKMSQSGAVAAILPQREEKPAILGNQ